MVIVAVLSIVPGELQAFRAFERRAAQVMARHGGSIERAVYLPGPSERELHLVRFPSEAAYQAYRADPEQVELTPLRAATVQSTEMLFGEDAPAYRASGTPQHVGIVACSAEGAALCYRTICHEGGERMGGHAHPEVSLHTFSLAEHVACLERGDWAGVGELMLASAHKLARAGADFLICPDNTLHQALPYIEARSPLPWLHIAEVVASAAAARGFRRLGLTGTRWLTESDVYPAKLAARGLEWVIPSEPERVEMNHVIMDELVRGVLREEAVGFFQRVIGRMNAEGCDAVVLGCTEIPLLMNDNNSPLPTLDSTRLLARAALERALSAPAPHLPPRPGSHH
jgi:aspartate racemase